MGLIPQEIIKEVLDRCDVVELIGEYVGLKKTGRNFKACCPFHNEKTPSFIVNPDKQIFHCFGCGVGGNVISFVMQHEHIDFPSAVRLLAQRKGIVIHETDQKSQKTASLKDVIFQIHDIALDYFHQNLLSGKGGSKIAQDYLKQRGIKLSTVQTLKMGFAPQEWEGLISYLRGKNISLSAMEKSGLIIARDKEQGFYDRFRYRVMFPIFDSQCRCLGFGARSLEEDKGAKYINSPETAVYLKREHFYGLHLTKGSIARDDYAVIVEGYMDFITPFQEGFGSIVASLGTALTVEQIRLLRRYTRNVIMLFDSDAAGESAVMRSLDILIEEEMNVRVAVLGDRQDPDSFVRNNGIDAFRERVNSAQSLFDYKLHILRQKYDSVSIEGRAKISSEMLLSIGKIKNHITQEGYLRKLAQALMISEQALFLEMRKLSLSSSADSPVMLRRSATGSAHMAERDLLRLLLEQGEMISIVRGEISEDDLQDDRVRPIFKKIFDLSFHHDEINISQVIDDFQDQETLKFLSELMAVPKPSVVDRELLCRDYVKRIKNDRQKTQRRYLCNEIQKAESEGDEEKLKDLKERFNQLIKRS